MVLQMFAQQFPQWKMATATRGSRNFLVPWPEQQDMAEGTKKAIAAYEFSVWRGDNMCLLEFLRKTDDSNEGKIVQWLQHKYASEVEQDAFQLYQGNGGKKSFNTWKRYIKSKFSNFNKLRTENGNEALVFRDYLI